MITTRKCKCGESFEIEKKDHQYVCAECKRQYNREWRRKRVLLGLPVRGITSQEWIKNYRHSEKYKATQKRLQRKYRNDPEYRFKDHARSMVKIAISSGKLFKQKCQECELEKVDAHHPDYSKPLLVVWLCRKCHNKLHKELRCTQAEGN